MSNRITDTTPEELTAQRLARREEMERYKELSPEGKISWMVRKEEFRGILTFGYIGNFERWGDDRLLFIWIDGTRQPNGKQDSLWSCEGKNVTTEDVKLVSSMLRALKIGRQIQKRIDETNKKA